MKILVAAALSFGIATAEPRSEPMIIPMPQVEPAKEPKAPIEPQVETIAIVEEVKIPEPPVASSGGDIETIVRHAARKYGIDENHFVSIAKCESTFNPNAVNNSYYDNGHPSGLFQHISGYWPARAAKYGYAGASVFNAEANANVTAAMFAEGHHNLWECK